MKAYGIPRVTAMAGPDVDDCRTYALKSRTGRLDAHSWFHNSAAKRRRRRFYKRAARRMGRQLCKEGLSETAPVVCDLT